MIQASSSLDTNNSQHSLLYIRQACRQSWATTSAMKGAVNFGHFFFYIIFQVAPDLRYEKQSQKYMQMTKRNKVQ